MGSLSLPTGPLGGPPTSVSSLHSGLCAGGVCPIPFLSPGSGNTCSGIGGGCRWCAARTALQGWGQSPPHPAHRVYSAAHSCQVCCGDEPVKFMIFFFFFLMPPFVLSPGACERCLASHSSSDGHPSPHPTTSSPCGFPPSPSSRSSTGTPDDCPFPRRFSPVHFRGLPSVFSPSLPDLFSELARGKRDGKQTPR